MLIMVNYDLNKTGKDYSGVINTIKSFNWAHPMESCWIISTNQSVTSIYNQIRKHTDDDDSLLVSEFNPNNVYGRIPKDVWNWISQNKSGSPGLSY